MAGAAATMAASALLFISAISAMAALSHCPRRLRVWPALLLATTALVMSDRSVVLMGEAAPLSGIRWLLAIAMLGSAAGTVATMAHVITTMCPLCQSKPKPAREPGRYKLARPLVFTRDEHEDGGP